MTKTYLSPIVALRLFFVTQSLALSLWLLRIPEVKAKINLNLIDISLALLMQPIGVLIGFFISPYLIWRIGHKKSCLYFGGIFIGTFGLMPFAASFFSLAIILFTSGLFCAAAEVSMNAFASEMEKEMQSRMMSRFHSFWSIGALISGGIVTLLTTNGVSFFAQQVLVIPILLILVFISAKSLPSDNLSHDEPKQGSFSSIMPSASLMIICITPFGALLLEGALMEWTAIFKGDYQNLSPVYIGIIFCSFTMSMTFLRYFGDQLINKFGIERIILTSILSSLIGMLIFAQSDGAVPSIIGASLVGAGIANIYPISITLAASLPGAKAKNVATVAFVSFTAFLIGPPTIGILGEYFGLELALSITAPISLLPILFLIYDKKYKN